jgi:4'-phosphopantetheinyl transferase EntD
MEGFTFKEISLGSTQIYFCAYSEFDPMDYTKYLTDIEKQRLFSFKHVNRRREFMATRILRHRVFGFEHIHYDPHGAPYIRDEGYISISHSRKMVGLALNKQYKIGLDLESPRENILDIKPKFLSSEEPIHFDVNNKLEVTKIWSAKEALYKLAGRKKIHFKTELLLSKDENGQWLGQIVNPENDIFVKLNIFEEQGVIVSINNEQIVKQPRNI